LLEDPTGNGAGPGDPSRSFSTDDWEMAAALPTESLWIMKRIRVFGLRLKLTSTFLNGMASVVLNKGSGIKQKISSLRTSPNFSSSFLLAQRKALSHSPPSLSSPPPKSTMLSLNPGCICDVCAEEYGPRNLPHSITCGQCSDAEPILSLPA